MMWYHNAQPFEKAPEEYLGFVYVITEIDTGKRYIGKKLFWAAGRKTVKGKKKKVKKESDWRDYYGSSKELLEQVALKGPANYHREILRLCKKKGEMNYYELREQILREVLLRDDYYNSYLGCRIHRKHLG